MKPAFKFPKAPVKPLITDWSQSELYLKGYNPPEYLLPLIKVEYLLTIVAKCPLDKPTVKQALSSIKFLESVMIKLPKSNEDPRKYY